MLAGQRDLGASMFGNLGQTDAGMFSNLGGDLRPDAGDMEKAAEAAQYHKNVEFESFEVETFHLSNKKQANAYKKRMKELFQGIQLQTHVLFCQKRHFVESLPGGPGYLVHIEWARFRLDVEPTATVGAPTTG